MLKVALSLLALYLLYRVARAFFSSPSGRETLNGGGAPPAEDLCQCSNCGKYAPASVGVKATVGGASCYFCCHECEKSYAWKG